MIVWKSKIIENWGKWSLANKIPIKPTRPLKEEDIGSIKEGSTRSVWMIDVPTSSGTFPVILKLYNGSKTFLKYYEWNVYKNLKDTRVSEFMPYFYDIQIDAENLEVWIFTEYLNVFGEKPKFKPADLYNITSSLARLHAKTFEHQPVAELIRRTVPEFQTERRNERLENIKGYLQQAKEDDFLKKVIEQYCPEIYELVERDLDFPEVIQSGKCLTHGDLHLGNICYDGQTIKFIDFGVATFSPCWLDVVKLVETILDNRFEEKEREIRDKCIRIYLDQMQQRGISFSEDPNRLYRMAYLMRVLEKELRRNLQATLRGKRPFVSQLVLKKISLFSNELHLI
ncbi:hypothetical protein D4T97_005955 [Siminovitchia acidinfaciens]|uniref:Aminoglycoside phosphotransferase domain-containing protein n=1 Tax=Siminovitchia acidinfaciens TaxID=2321395 RepID=A0A429Y4F5_9BACI|nr:phosphotransferase [Siminovitchia acidinfaciens]RST76314.1 hypothetical protein D4T97_005955 [Siminovitchia acidinfaciens]